MNNAKNKKKNAIAVLNKLKGQGFEAYFAGGCVRDEIMGREPNDYDVATNALPEQVEAVFTKTHSVGRAFGVIIVPLGGTFTEVATFRKDAEYSDGRRPDSVSFSNLKEDVLRRDFTINGIMYDPESCKVIDYVGGVDDIKKKLVRTIGDPLKRFSEDKLRLLRAVRFSAQLGFTVEDSTFEAIKRLKSEITRVSCERIREELKKLLVSPGRAYGIRLLDESGLLDIILPEVAAMKGVPQPPEFHPEGDVFEHTVIAMENLANPSFELAFALLLHDVGKPVTKTETDRIRFNAHECVGRKMAKDICRRLKCSNEETDKITWLVEKHMLFKDIECMRPAKLKRLLRHSDFSELLELCKADKRSMGADMDELEFCNRKIVEYNEEDLKPKPLLNGNDLIDLGMSPGPLFGRILMALEDAQLEGKLKTREEAVALSLAIAANVEK